jgi:dethiobiotin synthetase
MRKIFVTGIGTDVGKTVVSSILVEALQADYWKPVQTGSYFSTDASKVQKYISNAVTKVHPESYVLKQYMSPHAAAELEGVHIELSHIQIPPSENKVMIIEGAGGIMVPINEKEFIIDIIRKFDCETVLVIQNYLGSINHSMLSIDVLKYRGIKLLGIVFNGPPHKLSEDIIMKYADVPCIGRIYKESVINAEVITRYAQQFAPVLNGI